MDYNIEMIEKLTEQEAQDMALESLNIKEHTVYFVDFGGYFGYSAIVFKNGHHIRYANDYELHHKYGNPTQEQLRALYIKEMNSKLFTDEEIAEPLKSYNDYTAKSRFLHNYYGMREDSLSIFGDFRTADKKAEYERKKKKFPYFSPVAFASFKEKPFVERLNELYEQLEEQREHVADNYEYQKSAFKYEMANHEYHINYQADWDTLSAFGNIPWYGDGGTAREKYFDALGFNETQRRAYEDARREYLKEANERDW